MVVLIALSLPVQLNADAVKDQIDFEKDLSSGDYNAALQVARGMVEVTASGAGKKSPAMAMHLQHLAYAQFVLEKFASAEQSYRQSLGILEDEEGLYGRVLADPLIQLGRVYVDTSRYSAAMDTFRRAQHILHRDDGVYTLLQLEVVDWMAKVDVALNKVGDADTQKRFEYRISQQNYGKSSLEVIPAMVKMGDWFRTTGQYHDALRIYRDMIGVIQTNKSINDREMILPLRAIATVLYLEGVCCPKEYLEQILALLRNNPATDLLEDVSVIVALADLSLLSNHEKRAKELYAEAWSMRSDGSQMSVIRDKLFAGPVRLGVGNVNDVIEAYRRTRITSDWRYQQPFWNDANQFENSTKLALTSGSANLIGNPLPICDPVIVNLDSSAAFSDLSGYYMDLQFTVNEIGQTSSVVVVNSNSPQSLESYVMNVIERTRYRPRVVAGKTVRTDKIAIRQTFATSDINWTNPEVPRIIMSMIMGQGCDLLSRNA